LVFACVTKRSALVAALPTFASKSAVGLLRVTAFTEIPNPKSQVPNQKETSVPSLGFGIWDLGFGIYRKAIGPLAASTGNIDLL
jgi:hypothetical protein